MNRIKRFALKLVVVAGMTMAMSILGLAQQETMPDQFLGSDEIAAQMAAQQKNDKDKAKVQLATTQSSPKARHHKRVAKRNTTDNQTVAQVRR
jgi:hypothetical protein